MERYLKDKIAREGSLSFSEFMNIALYRPHSGYYRKAKYPPSEDFRTAPEMTSAFGASVARFLKQTGEADKEKFSVWELGAGRGKLAKDILKAGLGAKEYFLAEINPAAQIAADSLRKEGYPIFWLADISDCEPAKFGMVVANEFFDALPVEVVKKTDGRILKLRIALKEDRFCEDWLPTDEAEIVNYVNAYAPNLEEGQKIEIPIYTKNWMGKISRLFEKGVVLIFDYGDFSEELYSSRRREGTLKTHFRRTVSDNFLENTGDRDITASVNFSYVEDLARLFGFKARTVELCAFLISSGAEKFLADGKLSVNDRSGFLTLLDPDGMGGLFKASVLTRGIEAPQLKNFKEMVKRA